MRPLVFLGVALLAGVVAGTGVCGQPEGENLLAPMPAGFKVGASNRQPRQLLVEYVPAGETVQDWSRMITTQILFGVRKADPDALAGNMAGGWTRACPGGDARKVHAGAENGYAVSIWMFLCPQNPATGKPETMWMKVISGADSLYGVQYAYRSEATEAIVPPTMAYLKRVMVCDTRSAESKCPDLGGNSTGKP
jgi:hypothetical protein